ncbi:hypothetical protein ACH6EH_06685 [Paenibacillus sp. JSM ZJ436]|uniref:hypothetical protein n=1 Tax=Paenibacillus sp. JSM ZJ436 TaxID=3376190 RepID=UPI0037A0A599
MDYDEYMQSEPQEENNDLPSSFLSDEDLPGDTNVVIIPNYKINLDLTLDTYVEQITKAKTKDELKHYLYALWDHAASHGAISERLDRLQMEVEGLQYDLLLQNGYEIEFIDGEEE